MHVPTPAAAFPHRKRDVLDFAEKVHLPIILKPVRNWFPPWSKVVVHTEQELLECYDSMENPSEPNLMLQEYVPDEDDAGWIFHGYFNKDSQCLFGASGKKIRQWPPYHGMTSLGIYVSNKRIEKAAKQFMKAIGYSGIVDIDFRHDCRDGRYKVLDVNPRIGSNFRIFVADNGMDVARAYYFDLTKRPIIGSCISPGRKWLAEHLDRRASIAYHKDGNLPLSKWGNSYHGVRELSIFTRDDPFPFLKAAALMICRGFRRGSAEVEKVTVSQRSLA